MTVTSKGIFGNLTDDQSRCQHYHTVLDIIANRCGKCGKLYSCYRCHDEMEDHEFAAMDSKEKDTVMCGVCGKLFSYEEYSRIQSCPQCRSGFNPRCALHSGIYSCKSRQ